MNPTSIGMHNLPVPAKGTHISAAGAAALLAGCIWALLCFVFLVVLIPIGSTQGLVVRSFISLLPLGLLWLFYAAGRRQPWALTCILVVILLLTELSFRQRELSDTSLDPQNLIKLSVWGLGLIVAIVNWQHLRNALREPQVMWFTVFAVWCVLTSLYSPIPTYSFGAGMALLSVVLFGAVIRRAVPEKTLLKSSIGALSALLWIGILLYFVAPDRAMAPMEGGSIMRLAAPLGTPNSLGRASALVLLLCALSLWTRTFRWHSPLLLTSSFAATACLFLSQSRTAMVAIAAALIIMLASKKPMHILAAAIVSVLLILVFLLLNLDASDVAAVVSRTGRVTEITTLTGRTQIWSFYWAQILQEPILGYGYASTKSLMPLLYRTAWGWTTTHAHNMWLQVFFTTGLIGLGLFTVVLIAQIRYCFRTKDVASLGVLVFVLVIGFAEAGHIGAAAPSLLTVIWAVWAASRSAPVVDELTRSVTSPARASNSAQHI